MTDAETRSYLFERLLPLWAEAGVDARYGGFHNQLTPTLAPVDAGSKRVLVQARQLWVFSRAAVDAADSHFRQVADEQFEYFVSHCRDPRYGGWYLALDNGGAPLDRSKDTYIHAFALFALAAYHELSADPEALINIHKYSAVFSSILQYSEVL